MALNDDEARIFCGDVTGDFAGPVGAVVIDEDDAQWPGIVLTQQGAECVFDVFCFVARGDNHGNTRHLRWSYIMRKLWPTLPETTMRYSEVDPGSNDDGGEYQHTVDCAPFSFGVRLQDEQKNLAAGAAFFSEGLCFCCFV